MSPGPQGTSLGIDFGTSHTIAVVRRADGSVRPLLFDGAPLMPSAVCADSDGGLLVGKDAVHAGRRHPERFEPNPKRLIDRPSTLLGSREYPVPDLIAAVLDAVADECRRVVGVPAQVTLTVPAEWGPARRQVIEDAAARSGLGRVRLVPEPVAAATYYAEALKHRTAVGSSIVVYDLGAGTFDASVVRRTETGFETVALDGRNDLGGLDIDAALIEHLGGVYGDRDGWKRLLNPTTTEERRHFRDFQEEVRGAKERLSRHQQSDIAIPLLEVEAHLTRHELELIARPHLEQTIRVTLAVIRAAGLNLADSAGVFLVGGASRMPLVATMLHRELGVAPTVLDQPEVVVAEGSVLWTQSEAATLTFNRPYTPAPTPAQTALAPLTPQAAPGLLFPPRTEPQTQYRPAPQHDTPPAPVSPPASPPRQTLPPRTAQPVTPPLSVSGDGPEPPESDADRERRKRNGRRFLVWFVVVDLLIVAALAWYFNRDEGTDENGDDGTGGEVPAATSFSPNFSPDEAGALLTEIDGAHGENGVRALVAVEVPEPMLFSAGDDGFIRQWDLTTGNLVDEWDLEIGGVQALLETNSFDGDDYLVAVGAGWAPHVWTPATGEFIEAGLPEMVADGTEIEGVRAGPVDGYAGYGVYNGSEFELYDLENQESLGRWPLPDGYGYPRVVTTAENYLTEIVAVTSSHEVDLIDGRTGDPYGLAMSSEEMAGVTTEAFGVVYYEGTPYAMLYGSDKLLHFWDLQELVNSTASVSYEDRDDNYHFEMVDTVNGTSLLRLTRYTKEASAIAIDTGEVIDFAPQDDGTFTKFVSVEVDGVDYAVTGDEDGDIQFWSLGQ
ncbi:Hsp70 family protein [Glycomyces dulcitolivorans]|uniref:Hsp70 family protein n=1 Tax=Glycomyces dulcitolivorans TaxID=2200759 RepID=UPI000DD41B40|nr:Hsp70 family protein [Glycomyces dulcitolivorans]